MGDELVRGLPASPPPKRQVMVGALTQRLDREDRATALRLAVKFSAKNSGPEDVLQVARRFHGFLVNAGVGFGSGD